MIGDVLLAYLKKPKLAFEVSNIKQGKLGFSVYTRKKQVNKATVTCNKIPYLWEKEDGIPCKEVDLRIGDPAITFYPFDVKAEFIEDLSHSHGYMLDSPIEPLEDIEYSGGVQLVITQPETNKEIYRIVYAIPTKSKAIIPFALWDTNDAFTVRIRVVGEGLEEESDYILKVGLQNMIIHPIIEGKPLMEYVLWGFEVKRTSKFFYRKKRLSLMY